MNLHEYFVSVGKIDFEEKYTVSLEVHESQEQKMPHSKILSNRFDIFKYNLFLG